MLVMSSGANRGLTPIVLVLFSCYTANPPNLTGRRVQLRFLGSWDSVPVVPRTFDELRRTWQCCMPLAGKCSVDDFFARCHAEAGEQGIDVVFQRPDRQPQGLG